MPGHISSGNCGGRLAVEESVLYTLSTMVNTSPLIANPRLSLRNSIEQHSLGEIERLDSELEGSFKDKIVVKPSLTRPLVSFQANKTRSGYRWYKYKEGFSAALVEHLLANYGVTTGRILDPFAGSGTSLFAASALGLDSDGIELLPIGQRVIETKKLLENLSSGDFEALGRWSRSRPWESMTERLRFPELRITKGAYPLETEDSIQRYLAACLREKDKIRDVLRFALLCVIESVSYTRKDGQYLRWDYRSGRKQGKKPFDKGCLPGLGQAISQKIDEIVEDCRPMAQQSSFFPNCPVRGQIRLLDGSCLERLPEMGSNTYDAIITSPPYCNRYDYTRTYALELALLGVDENGLGKLRQEMLSCTVENRAKDLLKLNPRWALAITAADGQRLLQAVLKYLTDQQASGLLNNAGIPRMVRGYFYEMACVILECSRVMRPGAPLFMVNDNIRYAGASISADLILSSMAESLGFQVENILVLPTGKGNSSQQMGQHGRDELRKCIYVWRRR